MTLKEFFTQFFTWWNGQTLGTRFHTWRFGELVGTDEFGNRYYRRIGRPIDSNMGPERRWVIYSGLADLSRVPPCHKPLERFRKPLVKTFATTRKTLYVVEQAPGHPYA